METLNQAVSTDWVDIKASLSLSDGTVYAITNYGSSVFEVAQSVSAPTVKGHTTLENGTVYMKPVSGFGLWARTLSGSSTAVVTESGLCQ